MTFVCMVTYNGQKCLKEQFGSMLRRLGPADGLTTKPLLFWNPSIVLNVVVIFHTFRAIKLISNATLR